MNLNALVATLPRAGTPLPPAGADAAAAGGSFATLLDREQRATPEAADTPPQADGPQGSEPPAAPRAASAKPAARPPAERPAAKAADETRRERPAAASAPADAAADDASDAPATEDTPAADPALMHWLQGLQLPPAAAGTDAGAGAALRGRGAAPTGASAPDDTGLDLATKPSTRSPGPGLGALRGAAPDRAAAEGLRVSQPVDADAAQHAQTLPSSAAAGAAEAAPAAARFQDTLAALRSGAAEAAGPAPAGPGTAATPAAAAADAVASATLPLPLDDPQFPRAFGVQVSVLAREGVQKAELHLNPAEMGPVSVQIVMDGTQARIDFGADAAPTRALIEHSLPELAAALREAGLTLAGGGVSQHAGQGREAAPQAPTRGGAPHAETLGDAAATEARPLRRSVSAGGVDLYA